MTPRIFFLSLLAVGTIACGSTVTAIDHNDGGGGGSGGAGGEGTTSAGAGGCADYADEESPGEITLRFRNDAIQAIFIPTLCGSLSYDLFAIDGPTDASWVYDPSCLQTCEELQTEHQYACGACQSTIYRLSPGETLDVVWKGTGLRSRTMEAPCWLEGSSAGPCRQEIAAPAGQYRVSAVGYDGCSGECNCDQDGLCFGDATGLQATSDAVKFFYPDASLVEVVFGGCAFGCP